MYKLWNSNHGKNCEGEQHTTQRKRSAAGKVCTDKRLKSALENVFIVPEQVFRRKAHIIYIKQNLNNNAL